MFIKILHTNIYFFDFQINSINKSKQVLNFFKNERVYSLTDILRALEQTEFPSTSIKFINREKIKINFAFYEAELKKKYSDADRMIMEKKSTLEYFR